MTDSPTTRPMVFVSQDNERDYAEAAPFGDVVFLSNREIVPYSASANNLAVIHAIESRIQADYLPGVDYLLPAGGVLSMAIMFKAAFAKPGEHNVLKWDRHAHCYYPYRLK